ncbi:hypothetical protein [Brevundimonas diminuta]|uniref:hypothetical protein n=1 Tax=Brevundimonas diminuta TaxID=293 RepID=UPI003D9A5CAE
MTFEEIRNAVNSAWRDHVVNGVPATGPNEPVKQEIRAALLKMTVAMENGGFSAPPNWAADLADVQSKLDDVDAVVAGLGTVSAKALEAQAAASAAVAARDDAVAIYGSIEAVEAAAATATDAIDQMLEIAAGSPEAPSILNKANRNGSNVEAEPFKQSLNLSRTVAELLTSTDDLGAPGSIVSAQGLRFEVVASGGLATTAGGASIRPLDHDWNTFLPRYETIALAGVARVIGTADGYLIGGNATSLYRSRDGITWTLIQNAGFTTDGSQSRIVQMDNGEVIFSSVDGRLLRRSTGWATNPSTATWATVLTAATYGANTSYFDRGWGWRVYGKYVYATEYGNPKPQAHRAYLSSDYGATFTQVFDARTLLTIGAGANCHNHGGTVDPWHGPTPRLWQLVGDAGFVSAWYSDNLGSTWSRLDGDQFPTLTSVADGIEPTNYLSMDATPAGIVLGTDNWPDGTAVIRRDETYTSSPRIRTAHSFDDDIRLSHIAQATVTDGDWAFTLFEPVVGVDRATRIVATNVAVGRGWTVLMGPSTWATTRLFLLNEALWIGTTAPGTLYRVPLHQTKDVLGDQGAAIDNGSMLGGRKINDDRAMSAGSGARARGGASIAFGPLAVTNNTQQFAMGQYPVLSGQFAMGIVTGASWVGSMADPTGSVPGGTISGDRALGIGVQVSVTGSAAIGLGDRAKTSGTGSVAIGGLASATAVDAVALGPQAKGTMTGSTAAGARAEASGSPSGAWGVDAKAIANRALAFHGATASHSDSIALPGTVSVAIGSVTWGTRYDVRGSYTQNRAIPAAGQVASWWHDNGDGSFDLRFRRPDGVVMKMTSAPVA